MGSFSLMLMETVEGSHLILLGNLPYILTALASSGLCLMLQGTTSKPTTIQPGAAEASLPALAETAAPSEASAAAPMTRATLGSS
uniref:Uncharacterized protein n=1 Tax=Triticum urartu TaxID=4572 RepID=A0A8R7QV82_TRIUA